MILSYIILQIVSQDFAISTLVVIVKRRRGDHETRGLGRKNGGGLEVIGARLEIGEDMKFRFSLIQSRTIRST